MCSCLGKSIIYFELSTNTSNIQIKVKGWKQIAQDSTGKYSLYSNGEFAEVRCVRTTSWCDGTIREATTSFIPSEYRPPHGANTVDSNHNTYASINNSNGKIYHKSLTGGVYEGEIYWTIIYRLQ